MFHQVARAHEGRLLFDTWAEARVLWDIVLEATPRRIVLTLMPDHVHIVHPHNIRRRLGAALSGFTRWRQHHRGDSGSLFEPLPQAWPLADRKKFRRGVRYTHLNPCRSHLVGDPLSWAFSTHRDACGFAVPAAIPRAKDVWRFHHYVSSDPDVAVKGTDLPGRSVEARDPLAVLHAVSSLTRTPLSKMHLRGHPRSLYLAAARQLCPRAARGDIADLVDVHHDSVLRVANKPDPAVDVVARVVADDRFQPLHDRPLGFRPRRRADRGKMPDWLLDPSL